MGVVIFSSMEVDCQEAKDALILAVEHWETLQHHDSKPPSFDTKPFNCKWFSMNAVVLLAGAQLAMFGAPSLVPLSHRENALLAIALVAWLAVLFGVRIKAIHLPSKTSGFAMLSLGLSLTLDFIGWMFEWTWTYRDIQVPLLDFLPEAVFRGSVYATWITSAAWLGARIYKKST